MRWQAVLLTVLLLACLVMESTARKSHRVHRHHRRSIRQQMPVPPLFGGLQTPPLGMMPPVGVPPFGVDPMQFGAPPMAAVPPPVAPAETEDAAIENVADLMRFAQGRGNTEGHSTFQAALFNLLTKGRDKNQEDEAKLSQTAKMLEHRVREVEAKRGVLDKRSSMLTRLESCLDQLSINSTFKQGDDSQGSRHCDENKANELLNKEKELKQREENLLKAEANLKTERDKLQEALKMFQQQQTEWETKINQDALTRAQQLDQLAALNASISRASPKEVVKVKYVKVPEPVYKIATSHCEMLSDCGACTAAPGCGWCDATNLCLPTVNGSTTECDAASWNYNFCKSHKCLQHTSCRSCLADPRCGMCSDSNTCMTGELTGPVSGTCSKWNYATDFRFLSLNVFGRDLRNATGRGWWISNMIQHADADFVFLQEVEDWFVSMLGDQKWALNYHISDFGSGHAPGGLMVLSKYPLESVSYYERTDPGQVEVDQRARMLVVRPKLGSRNLALVTTTLDWRSGDARVAGLDYITSVLNSTSDVVLAGDFNFDADSQPETAHTARFADVWSRVHPGQRGYTWDPTTNNFAKEADPTSSPSRIDRFFVKSDFWAPSKIEKVGSASISPHYGLLAEMSFFGAYC